MKEARSSTQRGGLVFFTLVGLATLVLITLGAWQLQRLGEKRALIAEVEAAAKAAPRAITGAGLWDRVALKGQYLPEKTVYILFSRPQPGFGARDRQGKVPASGFGVLVMMPFAYSDCEGCAPGLIFVNRGFLPTPPNGQVPPLETPAGDVTVTGFLRPSEPRGLFQPASDAAKRVFFRRDLNELAVAAALPDIDTNRFLDREAGPEDIGPPYGIEIEDFISAIPNNHFECALTWWALALTNIGVALAFWRSRKATIKSQPEA